MSYSGYEASIEGGSPVELYEFAQGTARWYLTSCDFEVTYNSKLYLPSTVSRDRVRQSIDPHKDAMPLTFARDDSFAAQYLGFAPDFVTTVTLFRGHLEDLAGEFVVYWKGRVSGARASGNKVVLDCESVFTSIQRPGLRARFETNCRHALYSPRCGVSPATYKLTDIVTAVTGGLSVSCDVAAAAADGYYAGGMLELTDGSLRAITSHVGGVLVLSRPMPALSVGTSISLYPGCDHLSTTCKNKFNNLNNNGGFQFVPANNPFGGGSII